MYWEFSHIGFWTYYLDLATQIELEASEGQTKGVRPCLCICMDSNIRG